MLDFAGFRHSTLEQLRILPRAGAQLPNVLACGPGTPRSLRRARQRTQREAGVVPHQVMR
jgi:hypothetical protein